MIENENPWQVYPAIKKTVTLFWFLTALESAGVLVYLVMIPADTKNALLFGFSAQRLLMMAAAAVVAVVSILAVLRGDPLFPKVLASPLRLRRWYFAIFVILAIAGWQLSFIAQDQLGILLAYFLRLQPFFLLLTALALQAALLLAVEQIILHRAEGTRLIQSHFLRVFCISAAGFLLFWLLVLTTGIGIGTGNNYWNKAGVPLLGTQILTALGLGLSYLFLERRNLFSNLLASKPWLVDLILAGLIWAGAAFCWAGIPAAVSRFNTQPLPPNYASYPYSDAMEYALSAERIMQGKNISYAYVDKPLHLIFLVLVQLLGKQDFNRVILAQTILLAAMPALIYLLGKNLLNRPAGVAAGVLAIFYQMNSIRVNNLIQVSNVKMMLSEPLTAVGVLVICLLAVNWLKSSKRWWENLMLTAGAIGIGSMMRLNVAALGLVVLLAAAVQLRWRWKRVMWAAAVSAVFFSLALTPWMIRNTVVADSPVLFLKNKIQGVIWKKRISPMIESAPTVMPTAATTLDGIRTSVETEPAVAGNQTGSGFSQLAESMASNYAHNLVATFLMIPPVLSQGDILHIIREPYWDIGWEGQFTRGGTALLIINLCVVSLGVAAAWKRNQMAGIFPLLAFLAYHITNAISVVSGGRYIVAVDWVIYFYLAFGLIKIAFFLFRLFNIQTRETDPIEVQEPPAFHFRKTAWLPVVVGLFTAGSLPWAVEEVFPERYPEKPADAILQDFEQSLDWEKTGLNPEAVKEFLEKPEAALMEGQAFFPKFFEPGQGDTGGSGSAFSVKDYPHFAFVLQGHKRSDVNVYLEEAPVDFMNGVEAFVLGCQGEETNEALIITTLSPRQTLFRPDLRELKCPLAGPE